MLRTSFLWHMTLRSLSARLHQVCPTIKIPEVLLHCDNARLQTDMLTIEAIMLQAQCHTVRSSPSVTRHYRRPYTSHCILSSSFCVGTKCNEKVAYISLLCENVGTKLF
jgi:hypothetical protein